LAAPNCPLRSNVPTDVAVRIHESVLSNLFERTFSGKTFTNEELAQQIGGMFGGKAPAALTSAGKDEDEGEDEGDDEEKDEAFSITFSTVRPIQFEFDSNSFGVAISGRRFSQGDRRINAGLKIGLRFKIKHVDGKLKFVRDGKAKLDYVNERRDAKTVAFRSFLNGKLNPEKGEQDISIDLPDNLLPIDQLKGLKDSELAQGMTLVQCRSEDGWIYLGWNQTPKHMLVQHLVDFPAIWTETVISTMNDVYIDSSSSLGIPLAGPVEGIQPQSVVPAPSVTDVVSPIVPPIETVVIPNRVPSLIGTVVLGN